jgi:hypothetical protein
MYLRFLCGIYVLAQKNDHQTIPEAIKTYKVTEKAKIMLSKAAPTQHATTFRHSEFHLSRMTRAYIVPMTYDLVY